ncbi:tripartite tricarboxylate transporter TctB family protein [Pseudoponticoccus marisrubri]|uniref:DUF1468 domain-containing protein n=1 Tax=Pseudoponticoccus marisrubri TaxID=1685382 RepID=A0A0W7WE97_9RHOB|nr:tripartite tricarboxylate transporter TctB family protein [Pseudoponticoccus marisrubri]KUF08961.1 hypothetical protein AVJ23_19930 [Pseudoponticoccus marisrubri]
MRQGTLDRILSLVLLATAAVFLLDSRNIAAAEARMFPLLILGLLAILALALFGRSFLAARQHAAERVIGDRGKFLTFVACTGLYAASVSQIGFFTASALYVPVAGHLLGLRKAWVNLTVTAGFLVATYLVFVVLFSRPLPVELIARFL